MKALGGDQNGACAHADTPDRSRARTHTRTLTTREQGALLSFAALISLNLGLMNAIPLPALDGALANRILPATAFLPSVQLTYDVVLWYDPSQPDFAVRCESDLTSSFSNLTPSFLPSVPGARIPRPCPFPMLTTSLFPLGTLTSRQLLRGSVLCVWRVVLPGCLM